MGIEHVPAWNMDSSNLFGTDWVVCNYCNEKTDMTRCRLMSEGQGSFKCGKCASTTTVLNRFLGAGVAQTLQKIPPAEREKFFKFAKENVAGAINEIQVLDEEARDLGEALPVWRQLPSAQRLGDARLRHATHREVLTVRGHHGGPGVGQGVPRASSRRLGEWDQRQVHHRC